MPWPSITVPKGLLRRNEDRKTRVTEIQLYKEIRDDLVYSLTDLENGLENNYADLDDSVKLRDYIKNKKSTDEDISSYLRHISGDDQFFPRTALFEALKSLGFKTLSNDTLRENITNLYQLGFVRIVGMGRDEAPVRNYQFLMPFQDKYMQLSDNTFYRITNEKDSIMVYQSEAANVEQMMIDETFLLKLQDAISIRIYKIRSYLRTIGTTKVLIGYIEKEIQRLKG